MIVAHNLMAINSQRQFNIVTGNKAKTTEKLSSGYRINRSADDAAGLAISEKMRRQIRGLNQGASNTLEGISLLQVADGALNEVHDLLHRVTELSVKAANGTNQTSDREYIQQEINQIMSEINRISDDTEFNELKLFKGSIYSTPAVPGGSPAVPPATPPVTPATPTDYITPIQSSFRVSGTPNGLTTGLKSIQANSSGLSINGEVFAWSSFKASGSSLNMTSLSAGTYSLDYRGLSISFAVQSGAKDSDVITALDGASFNINEKTKTSTPITYSNINVSQGSDTDLVLTGAWHSQERQTVISADEAGITLYKSTDPSHIYNTFTWSSLGITDLNNAGGKTISINDSVSGISFDATIATGTTKDELLSSLKTNFMWDYIDCYESQNALHGIEVVAGRGIANAGVSGISINNLKLYHNTSNAGVPVDLYSSLGYTTPSSRLNGVTFDVKITKNDVGNYQLTMESPVGGSYSALYNKPGTLTGSTSNYGYFGNYSTSSARFNVYLRGTGLDADKQKALFESNLDKVIASVTIPNPYNYAITSKTVTTKIQSVNNVKTNKYTPPTDPGVPTPPADPVTPPVNPANSQIDPLTLWIQSGVEVGDGMNIIIGAMDTNELGINNLDVTTVDGANNAISAVDIASEKISRLRSTIGAQQNRLEHTYNNVTNIAENTQDAESQIRDTDMANEMVALSMLNILEQAGIAMMGQANQSNQGVLGLL